MAMARMMMLGEDFQEDTELDDKEMLRIIPFLELAILQGPWKCGVDMFTALEGRRFMKTHLPFELWKGPLEKYPGVKVIMNIRNPKDTLVSFYHHYRSAGMLGAFNGTWDQFFEVVVKAKMLPFGDLFQNTADWYKFNKDRENSLILTYEEMKKDHRGHLIKIAKFLGFDLSERVIDLILKRSTMKSLKENRARTT